MIVPLSDSTMKAGAVPFGLRMTVAPAGIWA